MYFGFPLMLFDKDCKFGLKLGFFQYCEYHDHIIGLQYLSANQKCSKLSKKVQYVAIEPVVPEIF